MSRRTRYIRPGFFDNEELSECSLASRLYYIGLWTMADRDGYVEYRPRRIKKTLFGYDDEITAASLDGFNSELASADKLEVVEVDGAVYIKITNWTKHQKIHPEEPSIFGGSDKNTTKQPPSNHPATTLQPPSNHLGGDEVVSEVPAEEPAPPPRAKSLKNKGKTEKHHLATTLQPPGNHLATTQSPLDSYLDSDLSLRQVGLDANPGSAAVAAPSLPACLEEFWRNLGEAGVSLPDKQPFWLRQSLSNGQAAKMLAASRQLGYTALTEGNDPCRLNNFKNADWVARLAAGDFNRPGKGPPPPPVDPEEEYIMFHPAGARMKRKDIREWLKVPANKAAYEAYKDSQARNVARDKARAEGERTSEPVPEGMEIPRAVPKDPNESFNTEAARQNALASIAKWQERNE